MKSRCWLLLPVALIWFVTSARVMGADGKPAAPNRGDRMLADYFRAETTQLAGRGLAEIKTLADWNARRAKYREQLFEMLSLSPPPARADLQSAVTGRVEHDAFTVEKLHFQSLPGLYVTANLYLPKHLAKPAPTILYLSGHGPVISNGVSYGNKVAYQHHGAWFARNGYVCLILDTLQLGEIQGLHHGTYREGLWWWNARGYTPAGVEAWNSIRALDYLQTRPEVEPNRFGATGRSGGGAYSWWIAALDDRIKVVAPVAGITDLHNHVVDGTVEGHCDCMFTVNTYRWDYPQVAALIAPRPLLIVNTDADTIFPLNGVQRTHAQVKRIYELHQAADKLGLVIGPGPHKDTQDLQVPVFRWFNRHLKGEDPVIEMAAVKLFTPQQLKVFATLPTDALNTNIHETFVPMASPLATQNKEALRTERESRLAALKGKSFAGWPDQSPPLALEKKFSVERDGLRFQAWDFTSQEHVRLRLYIAHRTRLAKPDQLVLNILGATTRTSACPSYPQWLSTWQAGFGQELNEEIASAPLRLADDPQRFAAVRQQLLTNKMALAWIAPRGLGLTAWSGDARKQTQIRRRFMLLGQTLDGMRVWDIRRAVQALRTMKEFREPPLQLQAEGDLAGDALYASLFEPGVARLELWNLPPSHRTGPDFLNVLRVLDLPDTVALAAERHEVRLRQTDF